MFKKGDFYIYMYYDKINEIYRYVGKGCNERYRIEKHTKRTQPYLRNKIDQLGEEHIEIHFVCVSRNEELIYKMEEFYIEKIGRQDLNKGPLWNLTCGGDGVAHWLGKTRSKETKEKISRSQKGKKLTEEHKRKISVNHSKHMLGKKHSKETKLKISKAHKGIKLSKDHCDKIGKTKKGKNHPFYGKHHSEETKLKISEARKGKNIRENNFMYNKKRSRDDRLRIAIAGGAKLFYVLKNNVIIAEYINQHECARELNLESKNINACLNQRRKFHKNYTFQFMEKMC